jgi:FAD/FMN-containing dehydrogenase
MPNYKSNHTYENWARTLRFKPERFFQPESEEQVVEVVREVLARGGRVRTHGGGHSWSHFIVTDDTLIQLDKVRRAMVADVLRRRYTIQAGVRLKDLIRTLALVGLAFRNIGSITEQSIAGAISTGTHGTGLRLKNISNSISGMKLVTGTGDLLTIKETDTDLLEAARVSVGALGIITEVTIDCVPMYNLEHATYFCKFDDVVDKLAALSSENERILLWWLVSPIGAKDNVLAITMNPPGAPAGILGQAGVAAGGGGGAPLPMDTNDLLNLILKLFPMKSFQPLGKRTGPYHEILTIPLLPVFHRELEYAIPAENAAPALRALRKVFVETDLATTLPVEVRYVAADQTLLSPANGRDVCYIGVSTQPNANEAYSRVEPILKEFGGRPHWGKHFSLTRAEVEAMYPDSFDKFRRIRKELDPKGVFTNTLIQHFFD